MPVFLDYPKRSQRYILPLFYGSSWNPYFSENIKKGKAIILDVPEIGSDTIEDFIKKFCFKNPFVGFHGLEKNPTKCWDFNHRIEFFSWHYIVSDDDRKWADENRREFLQKSKPLILSSIVFENKTRLLLRRDAVASAVSFIQKTGKLCPFNMHDLTGIKVYQGEMQCAAWIAKEATK